MNFNVKLNMIEDVKNFTSITTRFPYNQQLKQGYFVVDAKSILGVMSLDLSKPVTYVCEQHDPELAADLFHYKVGEANV